MKLKKKHWFMILAGGVILILLVFSFLFSPSGIDSLDPEDYKDNPDLSDFVKDIKENNTQDRGIIVCHYYMELSKDSRLYDICVTVLEDKPSYFQFLMNELSFSDIRTPKFLPDKWEEYCIAKTKYHAHYMVELAVAGKKDERVYPLLIKYLSSEWPRYRTNSIIALGKLGDKRAVGHLISVLEDRYEWEYIRCKAATALGKLKDEWAITPLLAALKDRDRDVSCSAADALGEIGKPAVEPLIPFLKDKDYYVRRLTASTLGRIGDKRAAEPLISAFKNEYGEICEMISASAFDRITIERYDQHYRVLEKIIGALEYLKDKRAVDPLIEAFGNKKLWRCRDIASALGQLGDKRAVEPLIRALQYQDSDIRSSSALALGRIGDKRAINALVISLKDEDETVRFKAALALGKLGDKRGIDLLFAALKEYIVLLDEDEEFDDFDTEEVHYDLIELLGSLGDKRAIGLLEELLKKETDQRMIEAIKKALETLKSEK